MSLRFSAKGLLSFFSVLLVILLPACGGGGSSNDDDGQRYQAEVRRTSFGIPHIKADDFGSMGYAYGYVHAQDNLCVLAEDLLTIRGERAKFMGRDGTYTIVANGATANNVDSDFFWKFINMPSPGEALEPWKKLQASAVGDLRDVTAGFVAGFNRYINEIKVQKLHAGRHASCRDAEWLQPITEADMSGTSMNSGTSSRYSGIGWPA